MLARQLEHLRLHCGPVNLRRWVGQNEERVLDGGRDNAPAAGEGLEDAIIFIHTLLG
jgi:hypothetical protein